MDTVEEKKKSFCNNVIHCYKNDIFCYIDALLWQGSKELCSKECGIPSSAGPLHLKPPSYAFKEH